MPDVTVIIPVAPYHEAIAQHAIHSVRAQTVQADLITVYDTEGRGAGWARNQGLAQVQTPFVVFLDADDVIARAFVEHTLKAWQPKFYVYTDWMQGIERITAPACAWVNGTFHVITTLIPTAYLRAVGGFDETLPAGEDTDLYLKLMSAGWCGLHLRQPLFRYGEAGQRSHALKQAGADGKLESTPLHRELMEHFTKVYGSKPMACCGQNEAVIDMPIGARLEGDVLALSLRAGNHFSTGAVTGRQYERTGNGKPLWMDRRDAEAQPHLYQIVEVPQDDAMQVLGEVVMDNTPYAKPALPPVPEPAPAQAVKPNVSRVIGAYRRGE